MSYLAEVNRILAEIAPEMDITVYLADTQQNAGLTPAEAAAAIVAETIEQNAWLEANPMPDPEDCDDDEPDAERIAVARAYARF